MRFFIRFSLLEVKFSSLFFEFFVCLNISPKNGTSPYFEPFYIVKSMQLWYYLELTTGMRLGEICALEWT